MRPNRDEVRWLFFSDDEITELKLALSLLEERGETTTESDMLLYEIREELEQRERVDSSGYNHSIRKE